MEERHFPRDLYKPPRTFEPMSDPYQMRPVFGSIGTQYVEFKIHEEYSAVDSTRQGKEVRRPIEICLIQNDKFSRVPIRINDLSPQQKVELAPLYKQFKNQEESDETQIVRWEAASDMEKALLLQSGISTVEQLARTADGKAHELGIIGAELIAKARRHLRTKEEMQPRPDEELKKEVARLQEEITLLRQQKSLEASEKKESQAAYFERQVEIAAQEKPKRHRRTKAEMEAARGVA